MPKPSTQTMTVIECSPNPGTVGQELTFTVTVSADGSPVDGEVSIGEFVTFGMLTPWATLPLVDGQATYATSTLEAGQHKVVAGFAGGDGLKSSSGTVDVTVN